MCIVFIDSGTRHQYKYIILSNRDELFGRPTLPSSYWTASSATQPSINGSLKANGLPDKEGKHDQSIKEPTEIRILGGRDVSHGGTWLGITENGRFAVVTNFQEHKNDDKHMKSRGELTTNFLSGSQSPKEYLEKLKEMSHHYAGFNLVVGDGEGLYLFSNRDPTGSIVNLSKGQVMGVTNGLLDDIWFKTSHGTQRITELTLPDPDEVAKAAMEFDYSKTQAQVPTKVQKLFHPLYNILEDRTAPHPDSCNLDLYQKAGRFSSIFVDPVGNSQHEYGTRCSIVILIDSENRGTFYEKSLNMETGEWEHRIFHFSCGKQS